MNLDYLKVIMRTIWIFVHEKGFCGPFVSRKSRSKADTINPRFTIYPRARNVRNLPAFKVKSILKGTEVDRKILSPCNTFPLISHHFLSVASGVGRVVTASNCRPETLGRDNIRCPEHARNGSKFSGHERHSRHPGRAARLARPEETTQNTPTDVPR